MLMRIWVRGRLLLTGGGFREVTGICEQVEKQEHVYIENSRVKGPIHDAEKLCHLMGSERVLFGTNSPITTPESPKMSIEHAGLLSADKQKLSHGNACRLFGL